jgi:rSAM/selenodomain-associated transferase 1
MDSEKIIKKSAVGIFFRIPTPGKVKKRLASEIGEDAALAAYESMLKTTIENVLRLEGTDIYGFYEGGITSLNPLEPSDNSPISPLEKLPLIPQRGNDIGERMYNAIRWLFDNGYKKISLIGADSPDLPLSFIKDSFQKLEWYELVVGPSEDGGYYLIGMKKPIGSVFKNIELGSNTVLKDTVSNALFAGINYFLLPDWYDIDDLSTLNRWRFSKKQVDICERCQIKN